MLIKQFIYEKGSKKEKNKFTAKIEKLRIKLINYLSIRLFLAVLLLTGLLAVIFGFEICVIFIVLVSITIFFIIYWPKIANSKKYDDLNQELNLNQEKAFMIH